MKRSTVQLQNILKTLLIIPIILLSVVGCNDSSKDIEINTEPVISTFYLIRHAEKDRSDKSNPDPELNQKGLDRAIRWAEVFDPIPIDAILSTNYERTSMMAAPTSVKKNIDIEFYDPNTVSIEDFKAQHAGSNVLIVGHSNTTPDFVNKLLGDDKYQAMDDNDNASLFIVRFIDDVPTDIRLKMD